MKANFKKVIVLYFLGTFLSLPTTFGQENRFLKSNSNDQAIVMTWNKNTPEQEMQDDIKALKEQGITIEYSNLKRNTNGEIIALRIEYKDLEGNYGSQEYNGSKPIAAIRFYKNKDEIGFGENKTMGMAFSNFDFEDLNKAFRNQIQINPLLEDDFGSGTNPNYKSKKKSKIIIQDKEKKPLIIEDGKVIKGGEDYSQDEIDKIMKQDQFKWNDSDAFNFNSDDFDLKSLKEQMDKMQNQLLQLMPNQDTDKKNPKELQDLKPNKKSVPDDLKKGKEEAQKTKNPKEEAQKEKSEMEMRKI